MRLLGTYVIDAVTSSGILKAKQKLGVTFNSDKLGSIDFTKFSKLSMCSRGVARGGAAGARAPPEFGRSVNPIQTREADYAPHTTASPPGFKKLSTSL